MKVHVYDFRWIDETSSEFQASAGDIFGKKRMEIGDSLSIEIMSDIFCAGNRVNDIWKPCPEKNIGKAKCEICKTIEQRENFVFTSYDGFNQEFLNAEDLEKINVPHLVYLALFDKDLIKVGVSKKERRSMRQIEQGSLYTLFIAETPEGTSARRIETLIKKNGTQDKIQSGQKKEIFAPEITEEEALKILNEEKEKALSAIEGFDRLQEFIFEYPEFASWKNFYHLEAISASPFPLHFIDLEKDESLSGKITAIKGSLIALETGTELIAINAKDLLGKEVDFSQRPFGFFPKTAFQNTLF